MSQDKKIKIAFCIPCMVIGGVESVFANTIEALEKNPEFDISVYMHADLNEPFWIKWFKERPWISVYSFYPLAYKFEKYKGKFGFPIENIRKILFSLYKKYRNIKIRHDRKFLANDVIIDWVSGSSFKLLKSIKIPKVTWLHCSINYAIENKITDRLNTYDKIVCISDSLKSDLVKLHPEYKDKLIRIYNIVDHESVKNIAEQGPCYDGKYFLCVGRIDYDKDIKTIISGFNDFWVRENKPDVKMVFVGDGNIMADMKKMAMEKDACNQFVFLGKIPKPYGYMRGAVAHILSSYNEGLPTVLIEAMAAGTLNISSNCPSGPHEILLDGKAGILFEPGNASELSKIMSDVFHERVDVDRIKNCATESLFRFDSENIAKEILDVIKKEKNENS